MDSAAMIWIIVAIAIALVAVIVIALVAARRNAPRRDARKHERAEDLRAEAHESAVAAQEIEAQRARAQADAATAAAEAERAKARAAEAEVDARRYAEEHAAEVEQHRADEAETLRKADKLDPYATDASTQSTGTGDRSGDRAAQGAETNGTAADSESAEPPGPRRRSSEPA